METVSCSASEQTGSPTIEDHPLNDSLSVVGEQVDQAPRDMATSASSQYDGEWTLSG